LRWIHENSLKRERKRMIKYTIRRSKRSNATVERATVNIGKKGSTDFLMNEIFRRLKQRKVVKGILKTALIVMKRRR